VIYNNNFTIFFFFYIYLSPAGAKISAAGAAADGDCKRSISTPLAGVGERSLEGSNLWGSLKRKYVWETTIGEVGKINA